MFVVVWFTISVCCVFCVFLLCVFGVCVVCCCYVMYIYVCIVVCVVVVFVGVVVLLCCDWFCAWCLPCYVALFTECIMFAIYLFCDAPK